MMRGLVTSPPTFQIALLVNNFRSETGKKIPIDQLQIDDVGKITTGCAGMQKYSASEVRYVTYPDIPDIKKIGKLTRMGLQYVGSLDVANHRYWCWKSQYRPQGRHRLEWCAKLR